MDAFAARTGRQYHLFDYVGHPEAERVVVLMGSGAEAAHETVEHLMASGERVGIVKVRLYRPLGHPGAAGGAASDGAVHRRPRSHQGARRGRGAAVSSTW